MRELLISNLTVLIFAITAIELVLGILLFKSYAASKKVSTLCMALIAIGLVIDAFLIGFGKFMPNGPIEGVSRIRFLCHGALIPLIFPICGYALRFKKTAMRVLWIITGIIIILGIAQAIAIKLDITTMGEVIRHSSAKTPLWAEKISTLLSFGAVIPLIIVGIIVWIKEKTPHLFLSGFLMFAFSALGPATGNFDLIFFISMIGELFMILFFLLYAKREEKLR